MILAAEQPHDRAIIPASPVGFGYCPSCGDKLIPKCGSINVWHWAHRGTSDCDGWAEGETDWHLCWKNSVEPYGEVERVIGEHRADAVVKNTVIEFQHSSISENEVIEREWYYKENGFKVLWVLDLRDAYENERFRVRWRANQNYQTFVWKHAYKSFCFSSHRIIADFGDGGFDIRKIHPSVPETWNEYGKPAAGWGYSIESGCVLTTVLFLCKINLRTLNTLRGERIS